MFRLRACLIGTTAFQTYSPLLGVRLEASLAQTGDVDIAQFRWLAELLRALILLITAARPVATTE